MPGNSGTLSWQSLLEYLDAEHDTPIPLYGSAICILIIKPCVGIELQIRDTASFETQLSALPQFTRFSYEKCITEDYKYLAIKCAIANLLEAVLDFFYLIATNVLENKHSAKEAVIESYEQYKAILSQPLSPSQQAIQGLWGELYVLHLVTLNPMIDSDSLIQNWTGPTGQANDFSFGKTAIEIKTTSKQTDIIEISTFEQLDADRCWLIIVHAFNASREEDGLSINFLAHSIRQKLSTMFREILDSRISKVISLSSNPELKNFSMKADGLPAIIEILDDIPLITRSRLNSVFGKNKAASLLKGKYQIDLSSYEHSRKQLSEIFSEAQKDG